MRIVSALAAILIMGGCHSGPVGAAAISGSVSIAGIINQDWLAEQASFLKIKQTATSVSESTPAAR